jgi:hypothetical protein
MPFAAVLDRTGMTASSHGAYALWLNGADVIKVESPDGDPYRSYQGDHYSPHFQAYNRNKRSLALNLRDERGWRPRLGLLLEPVGVGARHLEDRKARGLVERQRVEEEEARPAAASAGSAAAGDRRCSRIRRG